MLANNPVSVANTYHFAPPNSREGPVLGSVPLHRIDPVKRRSQHDMLVRRRRSYLNKSAGDKITSGTDYAGTAPWISCKLQTRIGSRRRDVIASTVARAPLMVVMHGTR